MLQQTSQQTASQPIRSHSTGLSIDKRAFYWTEYLPSLSCLPPACCEGIPHFAASTSPLQLSFDSSRSHSTSRAKRHPRDARAGGNGHPSAFPSCLTVTHLQHLAPGGTCITLAHLIRAAYTGSQQKAWSATTRTPSLRFQHPRRRCLLAITTSGSIFIP